jgi:SAM-dependent methyltransferase
VTGAYTHGHDASVLRSHRWRTAANSAAHLLPHLRPGLSLLDVGCGPATITADLAAAVAPGPVLGIDPSAAVVDEARAAYPGLDLRVASLEEVEGTYDVVHAHQVLQHLVDPLGALRRLASLAHPGGGLVAVRDGDYPSMIWSPASPALDRWLALYLAVTRRNGADAAVARRFPALAAEAGLTDATFTTSTWTYVGDDAAWWADVWAERVVRSAFATQAVAYGLAAAAELAALADGWRDWGRRPGAVFVIVHGELLARV